jgi:putative transcriptional regulator
MSTRPTKTPKAKPAAKRATAKTALLAAMHETAADLHRLGFIDMHKMRKLDALCLEPVPAYSAEDIKALRAHHQLSQAVLASVLNTSLSTVRQWEIGHKHPSGPSLKLLSLLQRKGLEAVV